jgi:hypothetical protein
MPPTREEIDRARREQAERDLKAATAGAETVATSTLARQADRARAHFGGADAEPGDKIELWGRRIGRGLSLIAFLGLLIYLAVTYF